MSEFTTQGPAPSVSNLNGKFRWDQGSGLQQFSSTAIAVTPNDPAGTESDAVAIQEVIDSLEDLGGGIVFLRNGTYLLDQDITLPSNVTILGENADATILDFQSGAFQIYAGAGSAYTDGTVDATNNSDTITGTGTTWNAEMIGLSIIISGIWFVITGVNSETELVIESVFDSPTVTGAVYAIADPVIGVLVKDVTVQNSTHEHGAIFFEYAVGDQEGVSAYDSVIGFNNSFCSFVSAEDIVAIGCDTGIQLYQCGVWTFTDFAIYSSAGDGMYADGFISASVNNATFSSNAGNGITIVNSSNWGVYDMTVTTNGGHGVEVTDSSGIQFSSMDVQNNVGDGIKLTSNADRVSITGIVARNNGGYGVNVADATDNSNVLSGISYSNNTGGTYNDAGTGTSIISGTNTGDQLTFKTIAVSGQSDVVADSGADTLTLAAGSNVTLTTNATTDTVTIAAAGGSGSPGGSDTQVQFNDSSAFGGDAGMTYDKATDTLTLAGNLKAEDLLIEDSDASHYLTITTTSNLSTGRTLTLVPGDADRSITLSGNPTLSDWFDQSVKTTANPQFATIELGAASDTTLARSAAGKVTIEGAEIATASNTLTFTNKTLTQPTIADFTNAAHDHGDADDGGAIVAAAIPEGFFRGRYQQNTTNSAPTGETIQRGWGFLVGSGSDDMEEAVTFPTAFAAAPFVITGFCGFRLVASGAPDSIDDFDTQLQASPVVIASRNISTTGFTASFTRSDAATMANTINWGYVWIAIGTV